MFWLRGHCFTQLQESAVSGTGVLVEERRTGRIRERGLACVKSAEDTKRDLLVRWAKLTIGIWQKASLTRSATEALLLLFAARVAGRPSTAGLIALRRAAI
jgi:hypothetical protein